MTPPPEGDGEAAAAETGPASASGAGPHDLQRPRSVRLPPAELDAETGARQASEYAALRNKTVLELQQFRSSDSLAMSDGAGRQGTATLINLNPRINAWYLLRIDWEGETEPNE
jgi:hypothetical protein